MSELDWSALQKDAASAGVLPEGEYVVLLRSVEATKSSQGKPMLKYKARVTDGPQKDKPVYGQFTISPESAMALRMFFLQMEALGLPAAFFGTNPPLEDVAHALENRCAIFKLTVRQWLGQDRNNVESVKPLPAGTPLPPGAVTGPPAANITAGPPVPVAAAAAPPVPTVPSAPPVPSTPAPPPQPF